MYDLKKASLFKYSNLYQFFLIGLVIIIAAYEINVAVHRSIYLWDEATYANNSLEMAMSKKALVYTVNGVPDHHNSKPPLVIWLQALSFSIFGPNEFALRAPTFLALLGTLGLCIFYSRRLLGSSLPGIVAALVLLVSHGAMRSHVFLSGDLDGVLVFFTTFIFLHLLETVNAASITDRRIYQLGLLFLLGYFTKSTAILLIIPSVLLIILLSGHLKNVLLRRATWISAGLFLLLITGYYLIREVYDKGYWATVWYSEFTRVTVNIQPWLAYPWNAYFLYLWERYFHYPLFFLAITGPLYLILPAAKYKRVFIYLLLMALTYLGIISIPPVKLEWYDAPVYPLAAIMIGIALTELLRMLFGNLRLDWLRHAGYILVITGLLAWAFIPFRKRLKEEMSTYPQQEESSNALHEFGQRGRVGRNIKVIEEITKPKFIHILDGLRFYQKTMKRKTGTEVVVLNYAAQLRPGDTAIICQQSRIDSLSASYHVAVLDSCRICRLLSVGPVIKQQ